MRKVWARDREDYLDTISLKGHPIMAGNLGNSSQLMRIFIISCYGSMYDSLLILSGYGHVWVD